jgi:acyl transferase domain-containing protein
MRNWLRSRSRSRPLPPFNSDTSSGLVPNIITGRIANRLDLMGPNYLIDAACASSLVAVEMAARELRTGNCDLALAGGVNSNTSPVLMMIFSQLGALSHRGQLSSFDKDADGTLLGEGVGMVVLKRLAEAERDGNHIYAVLKNIGIASDGRATHVLAPRVEGEELALRRAYEPVGSIRSPWACWRRTARALRWATWWKWRRCDGYFRRARRNRRAARWGR